MIYCFCAKGCVRIIEYACAWFLPYVRIVEYVYAPQTQIKAKSCFIILVIFHMFIDSVWLCLG